ncbi:Brp/Blh family beta-carotene 15,15'-dioxygenase [Winogradskyella alexanderae]|uniref:Probable beta-carotene 15,15'-dioxygenase n=1 Tax=Winogradskyella alexanderae TaxID=2877123 RepID=A0ABS7XPA9_9FLAO|nr:Brp/Blh family beta-carotene 15,15'-dioxygenase [Winogradskyella alexanderae]MCA0131848.1 Brp/Blh family beta-carotene 15,15'-dioxygenase [Winogradskyella alexanderae]
MKYSIFALVLTVFLLWLTLRINETFEAIFAYVSILTVGIFHGSNDISLIRYIKRGSTTNIIKYLVFYVLLVLFTCLIFIKFPLVALIVFVAFSCYHFGEQHFHAQLLLQTIKSQILYVAYGILIFGLLFYFNQDDTSQVIYELTQVNLSEVTYQAFLILGIVLTAVFGFLNRKNFKVEVEFFKEIFLLVLFALLFKLASLLWAFAIYFIVWHSMPSLRDQIESLHGQINSRTIIKYIKSSLIYWLISVIGLVIVYYISQGLELQFITLFFAFLAAITIPHVIVMFFLNKK